MIGVDVGEIQFAVWNLVDHLGSLSPQDHSLSRGEVGLLFGFLEKFFEHCVILIRGLVPVEQVPPRIDHVVRR
jgi:hypothetical protein